MKLDLKDTPTRIKVSVFCIYTLILSISAPSVFMLDVS